MPLGDDDFILPHDKEPTFGARFGFIEDEKVPSEVTDVADWDRAIAVVAREGACELCDCLTSIAVGQMPGSCTHEDCEHPPELQGFKAMCSRCIFLLTLNTTENNVERQMRTGKAN